MSMLNKDCLVLIFEELFDEIALYSCLLVNRTWCEVVIPILWKNPWKYLKNGKKNSLLNTIISHLPKETREKLWNQQINPVTESYQKPLFNYIRLCKYLDLYNLEQIIDAEESGNLSLKNEIFKLFINKNTKIKHLIIPSEFEYQIQLLPGAEDCLAELEFLRYSSLKNQNLLVGLAGICKSIKKLEIIAHFNANNNRLIILCERFEMLLEYLINNGIAKLIAAQTKLYDIQFSFNNLFSEKNECFYRPLKQALLKHANGIKHLKLTNEPIIILSSFINLQSLEIGHSLYDSSWNHLKNVSLPALQFLKTTKVPPDLITSLIENTEGQLTEISMDCMDFTLYDEVNNERLVRTIYRNCPKLEYLKLMIRDSDILELERLLNNCQCLDGLVIQICDDREEETADWDKIFEILAKSAPKNLFKFKFFSDWAFKLESLESFFINWKGRHPMLLQTIQMSNLTGDYLDLIENYKIEGVVKKYYNDIGTGYTFNYFEWIKPNYSY